MVDVPVAKNGKRTIWICIHYFNVFSIHTQHCNAACHVQFFVCWGQPANLERKEMCYSCFCETAYCCILCSHSFANRRSIIKKNESVPGWVMGTLRHTVKYATKKVSIQQVIQAGLQSMTLCAFLSQRTNTITVKKDDSPSTHSLKRYVNEFRTACILASTKWRLHSIKTNNCNKTLHLLKCKCTVILYI